MKSDEMNLKMHVFETVHDHCVLPEMFMVARLDGRNFTRLTKETHDFEVPFDRRFHDYMIETTQHLMNCGCQVVFGYTQSDEISLLLHLAESAFGRRVRKLNSVLAGEASAKFSLLLGDLASLDCRIRELPNEDLVVDYFRWRNEDAHRNALNAHCHWRLIGEGKSAAEAERSLRGMSGAAKNEFLFQRGINFNDLPLWQRRGTGLYWEAFEKGASNPVTGGMVMAERRRIKVDTELPMRDAVGEFVKGLLSASTCP